jgi:hypothetical protein
MKQRWRQYIHRTAWQCRSSACKFTHPVVNLNRHDSVNHWHDSANKLHDSVNHMHDSANKIA